MSLTLSPLRGVGQPRRAGRRRFVPVLLVLALLVAVVPAALLLTRPHVRVEGLRSGATLNRSALTALVIRIAGADARPGGVRVSIDGRPMSPSPDAGALVVRPGALGDGRHRLRVDIPGRLPFGSAHLTRDFTVDTLPPALALGAAPPAASLRTPVSLSGTVEPGARLTADGKPVVVTRGRFELRYPQPPAAVRLVATDPAGNVTTRDVAVHVRHPQMRAVHLTALAWSASVLREPVLAMARAGKINAIELDVKDESGDVGYASTVPLAVQSGAATGVYDARKVLDQLHAMNVRVVGRIVCFRDPRLAQWAWGHGRREMVIQGPDGTPYKSRYGEFSFTNFADPTVRRYNIDLATEAARLGFDDILYDYVRRPDGKLSSMRFPGIAGTPEASVAGFVRDSRGPIRAGGAYLGLSVFGIAATRPTEIAQDIPAMGRYADYVSPMVYPSHWGPGEYGVANPNASPYDIVRLSLVDFQKDLKGTDTAVIPWLQDFSLGRHYGPAEVAAQIRGARSVGIDSFLLWNAGARYQAAALG